MTVLIVGTIGLDTISTPFGEKEDILGGSAVYAATAASFFGPTAIVSVAGKDFPEEHLNFLASRNIDTTGVELLGEKTFRWSGYYEYDMNQAHTRATHLNALSLFKPKLSENLRQSEYVFLANLDPEMQLAVLDQLEQPKLVAMDTMDFWINSKREALKEVIKRVDIVLINEGEARQFMATPNLPLAASRLLKLGSKAVIIKKGEHGALLFSADGHFSAPSYPQEMLRDPTGAGDSFAGGFMGYLAKAQNSDEADMRRAIIMGSVMASYNVEDFSLERLKRLTHQEINERFQEFKRFSHFEPLAVPIV